MTFRTCLPPRIIADDGDSVLLTDALELLIDEGWLGTWEDGVQQNDEKHIGEQESGFAKSDGEQSRQVHKLSLVGELLPEQFEFLADWFRSNYSVTLRKSDEQYEPGQLTVCIYANYLQDSPGFVLADWGIFEFVDYLKWKGFDFERVMKKVVTLDTGFASGSPKIWGPLLDHLGEAIEKNRDYNDSLTVIDLLNEIILNSLDQDSKALNSLLDSHIESRKLVPMQHLLCGLPVRVAEIVRHNAVLIPLVAKRIAERLKLGDSSVIDTWSLGLTSQWLKEHLRGDMDARQTLLQACLVESDNVAAHWTLLLLCDPGWHPGKVDEVNVSCANLSRASWNNLNVSSSVITRSNLQLAHLVDSSFRFCNFNGVDFTSSELLSASLVSCRTRSSSFRFANVSNAHIDNCHFSRSQFQDVNLTGANLKDSEFPRCNFTAADMTSLFARSCDFRGAILHQALLDDSIFEHCFLDNLDLRTVMIEGARFDQCSFTSANVEDARLDGEFNGCDFSDSLLTGSAASGIVMRDCNFTRAGLADIDWTDCDLRGAVFIDSAFHLGSSRCGTLDSPYPSHGTLTGYYTDDYEDLHYKNPESIRKAALVDCDLRGAVLDQTDFYLVDLRGSKYDPCYESHLRNCGAILDD